jgi:hypothetical protein
MASSNASTLEAEDIKDAKADESRPVSHSASPTLLPVDDCCSVELEESTPGDLKIKLNEIDPRPVVLSKPTTTDLPIRQFGDVNQMNHSKQGIPEPVLANTSTATTPKLDSIAREESPRTAKKLQIWFGDLSRFGFDRRYLSFRDQLAESAFWGNFDMVLQVLTDVERAYGQSWANAPRLSKQFSALGKFLETRGLVCFGIININSLSDATS